MASTPKLEVAQAIVDLYRTEGGRIVAILIRLLEDFDLAEEAAQEAFAAAVNQWQAAGFLIFPAPGASELPDIRSLIDFDGEPD